MDRGGNIEIHVGIAGAVEDKRVVANEHYLVIANHGAHAGYILSRCSWQERF